MAAEVSVRLRMLSRGFAGEVQRAKGLLGGLGQSARRISRGIATSVGKGLDRLAVPSTVISGLGVGTAVRELVQFDRRLASVRVNADASGTQLEAMRAKLMKLAGASTGQSAPELLDAVQSLLAKDSELLPALTNTDMLERLGLAATATDSQMGDLAETAYQLMNAFEIAPEKLGAQFDLLATIGKKGAFELKDMATYLPEVGAAMARVGQVGPQGLARTAAALQVVRRTTGTASTAANNLVNLLGFLQSPEATKRLGAMGIQVFDSKGQTRDLFELLGEIHKVTKGGTNDRRLGAIFTDRQARDAAAALLTNYKDLLALSQTKADSGILDHDAAVIMGTTAEKLKQLRVELFALADKHLGPWVDKLSELLSWLNDHPKVVENALKTGAGLTGLAMARRFGGGALSLFGGGGGAAGAAGKLAGVGGGSPIPVEVVNWPGAAAGMAAGGGSGGVVAQAAEKAATGVAWRAASLGRAGLAGAGGAALRGLSSIGAGGLAAKLGGGLATAGAGTVAAGVGAAALGGYGIGTGINVALPDSFKATMQNAMAHAMAPFSEDARRLVEEVRQDRLRRNDRPKAEFAPDGSMYMPRGLLRG